LNRRMFLKLSAAMTTVAAAGIGLERTLANGNPPEGFAKAGGRSQPIEAKVDRKTGDVTINPDVIMRHSMCMGCYGSCGNRIKIDRKTGQILRVQGNPYNRTSADTLPYEAPLTEAYQAFSQYQDKGLTHRGAICARGNSTIASHYDPMRVLVPLKRAGARGEGKWKPLTWEKAIEETVEGGKLFAEIGKDRVVEGFRQVYDRKTPLDPANPWYGPKSNQLVINGGRGDGRSDFMPRFSGAFGTPNYFRHSNT